MKTKIFRALVLVLPCVVFDASAAEPPKSSYSPVVPKESFATTMERMKAEKPAVMKKQMDLLNQRYDLRDDPAPGVTMSGGKAIQQGVRVKLKDGATWDALTAATPAEILQQNSFPDGFMGLPHPNHPEGFAFLRAL